MTEILFGADAQGGGLEVTDAVTGERVLAPKERTALEAEARKAAEQQAAKLAAEVARLEEIVRRLRDDPP